MKALTLWQPYASAMALALKRNETRPRRWMTLNCDVAICAAMRTLDTDGLALARLHGIPVNGMPFGKVLCVVFMQSAQPSHLFGEAELTPMEYQFGDYSAGRWIYTTGLLRRLTEPVPVIGRQGLFNLPPDVEANVREQLKSTDEAWEKNKERKGR
jgi:hypothetical protein